MKIYRFFLLLFLSLQLGFVTDVSAQDTAQNKADAVALKKIENVFIVSVANLHLTVVIEYSQDDEQRNIRGIHIICGDDI